MPPKNGNKKGNNNGNNNGNKNGNKKTNIPVAEEIINKGNGNNNGNNNGNGVILVPQMSKENLNKSTEGENINTLIAEREGQISPCTIS